MPGSKEDNARPLTLEGPRPPHHNGAVTVKDVLIIVSMLGAVFVFGMRQEGRLATVEAQMQSISKQLDQQRDLLVALVRAPRGATPRGLTLPPEQSSTR